MLHSTTPFTSTGWQAPPWLKTFCLLGILACPATALAQAPPPASWNTGGYNTTGAPQPLSAGAAGDGPSARIASNTSFGSSASLPGDPASIGGDVAAPAANAGTGGIQVDNIVSIIREGGVLMIPIIGCSIVLMVFVFERLMYLRRSRVIPRPFVRGVIEQLEQQQLSRE